MSTAERYDAVVIGSGEGGKYLAWHLAQAGQKTAVVERRWIGGSCPNINCLPSKNEIWSAGVARIVARAEEFGITTSPVTVDMKKVLQCKRDMVDGLIAFHVNRYKATGTELIMGTARVVEPKIIEVSLNDGGTRRLAGTDQSRITHQACNPLSAWRDHHGAGGDLDRPCSGASLRSTMPAGPPHGRDQIRDHPPPQALRCTRNLQLSSCFTLLG